MNPYKENSNFRKPPAWFRALNNIWKGTYPIGTRIRLDKDDLIKSARKMTGLHDLGKDFHDEPLERLLKSINEEANLHPIGRFITKQRFVSLLNIRLRAEYFFTENPAILEQELYPVWIIIGLQRTGTTKLHRLLACDPDHRVIPSWEVINPVPMDLSYFKNYELRITNYENQDKEPNREKREARSEWPEARSQKPEADKKRIAVGRMSANALKIMSPGFFAIHPIEVMEPEEDILLLDVSFMSTTAEAMMQVPSYAQWLENTDQSDAYAYCAKLLKFLQWMKPAKRWVLKTPHHLEFPDLIAKHFGEVHFLWPHRTLYESVPSFLSMVTYNQMIFSDQVDLDAIGRHWVRKTGYMLDQTLKYRSKEGNEKKFTDIYYQNLIKDSMGELSKIYSLNGGLNQELIQRFETHEKEHPHRKYGTHSYSLADFNLIEGDIDKQTANYQQFMKAHYGRT
ncbi:MAG: sulfotransferase [Bacteroidota bacterium]